MHAHNVLILLCILQELEINLVKATNHYERPAKEQHVKSKFNYEPR